MEKSVVVDSEPSAVRVAPCDACVLGVYPAIDDEVAQLLAAGPKARTRRALRGGDDHEPRRAASCRHETASPCAGRRRAIYGRTRL